MLANEAATRAAEQRVAELATMKNGVRRGEAGLFTVELGQVAAAYGGRTPQGQAVHRADSDGNTVRSRRVRMATLNLGLHAPQLQATNCHLLPWQLPSSMHPVVLAGPCERVCPLLRAGPPQLQQHIHARVEAHARCLCTHTRRAA